MSEKKEPVKESLPAQVTTLEELITYQPDAVVSKTIIKKSTGTVTLFAFDKGQGLSEHTAPFEALVYLVDGEAEISVAGKPNVVMKGEMIILPANVPHALHALQPFKMLLTMIKSS
ncbi:MAG: cupin domain-containing protein [Cyclobacteriaceae bacterium]|nr:cupin domain-containing protein [Cyclobacteriaceae bacterium]UYN85156.1 MAG: cupin domain-containing protein [Cyclobacteriaceae bacterium]